MVLGNHARAYYCYWPIDFRILHNKNGGVWSTGQIAKNSSPPLIHLCQVHYIVKLNSTTKLYFMNFYQHYKMLFLG